MPTEFTAALYEGEQTFDEFVWDSKWIRAQVRVVAQADSAHERRQRVLAALTDHEGNPKPWLAAEEIGYSPFCEGLSVRQIAAALSWLGQRGFVAHRGVEWKLTKLGLVLTTEGL